MNIIDMSEEALLEQLIEESGELIQVAAKRLRIIRGESPTPITLQENKTNLIEELADVCCCVYVTSKKENIFTEIDEAFSMKMKRWEERLNNCL